MAHSVRKRLGEMLLESGVIDAAQLQAALGQQRRWGGRLGQALVDLKIATEAQIVAVLSRKLGYGSVALAAVERGPALELALRLVPYEFAQRNVLFPYAADTGTIWVAMADPTNVSLVDELAFRTGRKVKVAIAGDQEIAEAVRRLYLQEKAGIEAIALEDGSAGSVEMVGNFEGGNPHALDEFFSRAQSPSPREPPKPAADPGRPAPSTTTARATQAIPQVGAEARLAEAVRKLKLEDEPTASRTVPKGEPPKAPPASAPEPVPTIELPLESEVQGEPEPNLSPQLTALLDGLDRAARAGSAVPEVARVTRLTSALVRVLLRKRLISESDVIAELLRK